MKRTHKKEAKVHSKKSQGVYASVPKKKTKEKANEKKEEEEGAARVKRKTKLTKK